MVFSFEQLLQIAVWIESTQLSPEEVVQKVAIIVTERQNYDSNIARVYLSQNLPPNRALVIDTAARAAEVAAGRIAVWLENGRDEA